MRVHIFQKREEIGMKLWTVQPVETINIIEKTGAFTCDETKSDKDFRKAYEWIAKEMDKRQITHPKDLTLPLWAWHTRDWKHKKPDGMDLELRYSHSMGGIVICLINSMLKRWGIDCQVGLGPVSLLTSGTLGFSGVSLLYAVSAFHLL